jgi:hypothetical protein
VAAQEIGGKGAQVAMDHDYRTARVKVADWRSADGVALHARHEVMHVALAELREQTADLTELLADQACQRECARLTQLHEHAVTRLCRAFDELEHIGGEDETYC